MCTYILLALGSLLSWKSWASTLESCCCKVSIVFLCSSCKCRTWSRKLLRRTSFWDVSWLTVCACSDFIIMFSDCTEHNLKGERTLIHVRAFKLRCQLSLSQLGSARELFETSTEHTNFSPYAFIIVLATKQPGEKWHWMSSCSNHILCSIVQMRNMVEKLCCMVQMRNFLHSLSENRTIFRV